MTRFGSSRPPIEGPGDARLLNQLLGGRSTEPDWSVKSVLVGDRVHILATCYCFECRAIRAYEPSAEELALMARDDAEDRKEQEGRRGWGKPVVADTVRAHEDVEKAEAAQP